MYPSLRALEFDIKPDQLAFLCLNFDNFFTKESFRLSSTLLVLLTAMTYSANASKGSKISVNT